MKDKLAAKKMAHTGFCGFFHSVARAGSAAADESFQLIPGARQTSIRSLFKVSMRRTRDD